MTVGRDRGGRLATGICAGVAAALLSGLIAVAGCTGAAAPSGVIGTPPTPGSVTETVPAVTPAPARTYALTDQADLAGIVVTVESVTAEDAQSTIPGEKSGPALVFRLKLRNGTSGDYRTALLETAVTDSSGGSASRLTGAAQVSAPPAVLAPGAEATAAFVYLVDPDKRKPVTLTVSVAGGQQAAAFTGTP